MRFCVVSSLLSNSFAILVSVSFDVGRPDRFLLGLSGCGMGCILAVRFRFFFCVSCSIMALMSLPIGLSGVDVGCGCGGGGGGGGGTSRLQRFPGSGRRGKYCNSGGGEIDVNDDDEAGEIIYRFQHMS